jgi:hypothetical protein
MSGLSPRAVIFFLVMLVAIGGIGVGAYQYGATGRTIGRILLVVGALLLACGTVLSGFTVGYLFLPAAIVGLVATLVTFVGQAVHAL